MIFASSEERVKEIDDLLWTYDPNSWLPHGTSKDGFSAEQPVWITCENDNANDASYLFLIDGIRLEQINGYKRIFDLFDGHDENAVIDARTRWTFYKEKVCNPPIGKKMKMVNGLKHNNSLESEKQPFL